MVCWIHDTSDYLGDLRVDYAHGFRFSSTDYAPLELGGLANVVTGV
ncbi:MAG: hypothetical protein WCF90_04245 [Methanomicrobiales archaeon]